MAFFCLSIRIVALNFDIGMTKRAYNRKFGLFLGWNQLWLILLLIRREAEAHGANILVLIDMIKWWDHINYFYLHFRQTISNYYLTYSFYLYSLHTCSHFTSIISTISFFFFFLGCAICSGLLWYCVELVIMGTSWLFACNICGNQ